MIDPATRWFEIARIIIPNSDECMEAFNNYWLCRYPQPQYIGFDNGSEFKSVFKTMCTKYGIKPKSTMDYNPQANHIPEHVHLMLGNMLRTFQLEEVELRNYDPFSSILSSVAWAIRNTYQTVLNATWYYRSRLKPNGRI